MAQENVKKPALFSYEYFCACKDNPRKEYAYYFYAACYRLGCYTMDTFARLAILIGELFGFVFDFLIWRNVKKFFVTVFGKIKTELRDYTESERIWIDEQKELINEYKSVTARLPDANAGIVAADNGKLIAQARSRMTARQLKNAAFIAAPVVCLVVLGAVFAVFASHSVALRVEYDGKDLGYIQNERVFDAAVENLEDKIIGVDSRYNFAATPLYEVSYVSNQTVYNAQDFSDVLLSAVMGDEIEEACGVFIDGEFELAVREEERLKEFMDSLLSPYYSSEEDAEIGFLNTITYETGMYPITNVTSYEDAVAQLGHVDTATVKYTCLKGDTLADVAEKNGLTEQALLQYNPQLADTTLTKGKKLTITIPQPYLQVRIAVRSTYTEPIEYDTVLKYSTSYYEGYTEVTTTGKNGSQKVTADIIYVNGIEVSREIISTEVVTKPRDRVKVVGTKTVPKTAPAISFKGVQVTGKFMWPVDGGHITCRWLGYSGHYGVDIGASKGTDIYAADGGVVISVKYWNYSYGYHLVIDHGNGYETRYAHTSKILVEVGDVVEKGDVIAKVGSTGNSFGNHLHFEIILNGQRINPTKYISG